MAVMRINNSIGSYAPDFELPGIDKQVYHLGRYLDEFRAIGVVFISNNCPLVKSYLDRLKQIQTEFKSQQFTLIGINSNVSENTIEDSFEAMIEFAETEKLNFPYLRDPTQDVARSFGAQVTPEVFLLDEKAVIRYAGRIDDCASSATQVKKPYLHNAIMALLNHEKIEPNYVPPVGSSIEWRTNKL